MLQKVLTRDCATLVEAPEHLHGKVVISFRCSCGECHQKNFRMLNEKGAFCKGCMAKKTIERIKQTTLKKYGVEHAMGSRDVRERIKQTNLAKYGVEYSFQSKEVQSKIKETTIKRYGVEHNQHNSIVKEKTKQTIRLKYGVDNPFQSEKVKEKIKQTNLAKYGVENPAQSESIQTKMAQTNLERYGVENAFQSEVVKDRIKQTNLQKYGVTRPLQNRDVLEKVKQTNLVKYGVENLFQSEEVQSRIKDMNMEKYGVEHHNQSREVQEKTEKNALKFKSFLMPSGEIRKVQGYEHFALRDLLKSYTEDQIVTGRKNVPKICYETDDRKRKVHFPDIFLPHENKIIEVKSTWTYKCKTDNVLLKKSSAEAQGYSYEIWCYDAKGVRVVI